MTGLEREHLVAGRQRVDQGGLPGAGARRGIQSDRPRRAAQPPDAAEHLAGQAGELRGRGGRSWAPPSRAAPGPGHSSARGSGGNAGHSGNSCPLMYLSDRAPGGGITFQIPLPRTRCAAWWAAMCGSTPTAGTCSPATRACTRSSRSAWSSPGTPMTWRRSCPPPASSACRCCHAAPGPAWPARRWGGRS